MSLLQDLQHFLSQYPKLAALAMGLFGACIGSFLNVCIHRIPKGISIVTPRSQCVCGQPIPFWFNIPILGWLILRGRAHCCGTKISIRYPLIEIVTAVLFIAACTMLPPAKMLAACVFLPLLIILAACDLEDMLVPDAPNFALVGMGLLLSILLPAIHFETAHSFESADRIRSLIHALCGIAAGTALIWWIRTVGTILAGREAMGEADIILCAGIGAFCGWQGAVFCLFGGAVIGVITALPGLIQAKWNRHEYEGIVPFVPSMAAAGAIWFFKGPELFLYWRSWVNS